MDYTSLVETYEKLSFTSKRLEKTYYISELLKKTEVNDLDKITLLLQGKVFTNVDERKIGISSRLIIKSLNVSTGYDNKYIENLWTKKGDLGDCAFELCKNKKQRTLFQQKLSVSKVFNNLRKLVEFEGEGTVDKKVKLISELLTSATPIESKFITRTILEDLRLGVGDGVMRDSIAWAFFPKFYGLFFKCDRCEKIMPNIKLCMYCANNLDKKIKKIKPNYVSIDNLPDEEFVYFNSENEARETYNKLIDLIQNAYDLTNDFGEVAKIAKIEKIAGLKKVKLVPLKPIKLMLYPKALNFKDAFEKVGCPCAIEYKYDGFRVQGHKNKNEIKLFTRSSEDVTKQFPDAVKIIQENIKAESIIFDCEVLGIDKNGKFLPFQYVSQRIKRKHNIHKLIEEIPIVIRVFDIMHLNGEDLLNKKFIKRREIMKEIIKENKTIIPAEQEIVKTEDEANQFYQISLNKGNEGAMMKNLDAPYKPGRKVGYGVKIKPTMDTLDLVITKAEWGEGKRASWLSSFTIACQNSDGELLDIGKVGTGFKEKSENGLSFEELTKLLKPSIIRENNKIVYLTPKIILEIEFEEIQKSPSYNSGFALRFPRVKMIRKDKPIEEISTLEQIEEAYYNQ